MANNNTPIETKNSSSKSAVSINPDGTETRYSLASVSVDDGTGDLKTLSVSSNGMSGENGTNVRDTTSGSNSNTANDDEAITITDLTSTAPEEDISQTRQTESSQEQSLIIDSFINNGSFEGNSFEGGTFQNWRTIGDTSIETQEIGIEPTDGEFQALITNGFSDAGGSVEESDLSQFLNLPSASLDALLDGNATEGSGIKQTFTAQAGDILEFDYSLLTNEATPSATFNDSAFFTLGNFALELGDTFDPTFSDKSVQGFSEATDSKTIKVAISQAGTYDLGFGIVDLTDSIVDSAILLDDVKLIPTGVVPFSSQSNDDPMSADVDFTFGSNGFEPVNGSSNTQQ
ncbi:hypothetical protein IQ247_11805 [Plectonema cf. radiosum LEGE 06105]|uniref:Uncharacterized protein n=1 Tax=Plectonema cf. radiosum LEGE 06105 TaxID=945769 RepID=A0A8J7K066_9CYAN|nr:hypothetical protein [Plectonema radiosum]MBE9213346.1 hypothetical protein [Plectonema cf. radiosum LEGE 06105]